MSAEEKGVNGVHPQRASGGRQDVNVNGIPEESDGVDRVIPLYSECRGSPTCLSGPTADSYGGTICPVE